MANNTGIIVEIIDGSEKGHFGIVYRNEQHDSFISIKKMYVHIFLDRLCQFPALHPVNQKKLVTLISIDKVKQIGFTD